MAAPLPTSEAVGDIYDEEFKELLELSQELIPKLTTAVDKNIARKWIRKLFCMQSEEMSVKKNRNDFFKYMLCVMQTGSLAEAPADAKGPSKAGGPGANTTKPAEKAKEPEVLDEEKVPQYISHWSCDRKTYVAAKPLPGKGAIIYMAVNQDPCYGWDIPGKRWSKR